MNQHNNIVKNQLTKSIGLVLSVLLNPITTIYAADTIWTDEDNPKGRVWLNTVNYEYGPNLHIQNTKPFYFSSNLNGISTVSVESGGKLIADGLIHVINEDASNTDAFQVINGGQATLNGGLYAENINPLSNYFVVAVHKQDSKLLINGDTTVIAPKNVGYGIHVGNSNNEGIFNGTVKIDAGVLAIYNGYTSIYNGKVDINMYGGNENQLIGIKNIEFGNLVFNDIVNVNFNSNSTQSNFGILAQNTTNPLKFFAALNINFNNITGPATGLYADNGNIDIQNDLRISTPNKVQRYSLYSLNSGKINITDSVLDITGRIQANANSSIILNSKTGSKILGDSVIRNNGIINFDLSGSNWFLTGSSQLSSLNSNNSNIYLNYDSNQAYRTLTSNSLSGNNSTFYFNTLLDDGSSQETDKLIIKEAATGNHKVVVNNTIGEGAQTINGIHVIQTGSSESNQTFYLDGGAVSIGAFDYLLHLKKQETTTVGTFDNWYLESKLTPPPPITPPTPATDIPVYTPDVGEYLAAETMGNTLFTSRLEDREGASQYQNLGNTDTGNVWVRAYGGHHQFKSLQDQLKTKGNSFITQIGAGLVTLGEEDQYNLGAMGGFATYDGKTRSNLTDRESKTKIDGYSLGLYGTWYAHPVEKRGAYIDSWVLWNKFNNKIDTPDQNQYKYDSSGITASIEAGGDYLLNKNGKKDWWIQPQVQLIYQGVHADDFKDAQGVDIYHGKDNVQARIGVKTYLNIPTNGSKLTNYRPYVALNFIHNTNPYSVEINNISYENEGSANLGELKLGVEGQVTKNSQVWLNASYVAGSHDNQAYQGNIGWKYNF